MRLKDKNKAVTLRKKGMSYNEIAARIPNLSKGTLSHWVSGIQLTRGQHEKMAKRLNVRIHEGRIKAAETNRNKKIARLKLVKLEATKSFVSYKKNSLFIAGLMLYWAEGSKKSEQVQFMNSDPRLIKLMLQWFGKYLQTPKNKVRLRLFSHKIYAHENHEKMWKSLINLPSSQFRKTIYKPTPHKVKRNKDYKGCMRIDAGGVDAFYLIKYWEHEFAKSNKL
jgi:hypothetical protein